MQRKTKMKILRDQHQIVFESLGSKAPGIAAFIKWLNFNMEEGEIWEEDLVFDQIYAKDGDVYIDWDPESEYMEGDPDTFPDRYLKILKRKGPKEFRLCSKNVAEEIASGDRDEDWPLERIINEGDEEAGITETQGANYEIGDEKLLWAQLRSPIRESIDLDKAKSIIESAGLKLNRVDEGSFAKDPSSYLRRFAKIRERVVKKATNIDPELMSHYKVTPLARQLNPSYEGDYLDRLVYGYMDGRPGDTDGMAKDLLAWLSEHS